MYLFSAKTLFSLQLLNHNLNILNYVSLSQLYQAFTRTLTAHSTATFLHTCREEFFIFFDAIFRLKSAEVTGISTLPACIITRLQYHPSGEKRNITNIIALSKLEQESAQAMNWVGMISYYHFNYSSIFLFRVSKASVALFFKSND